MSDIETMVDDFATCEANGDWARQLQRALQQSNIPTLLMVLLHLTGNQQWLSERYQCSAVRGLDDNDPGGLSEVVQQEIRDAAYDAILRWKGGVDPHMPAPNEDLLVRMLATSVGENVPANYGPMISAWLGLDPEFAIDQRSAFESLIPEKFSVVVIGAGVAGMAMSIRLRGAGIEHVIIEKNPEVGGTWYENRYPACGVDTPNHIYSYSFAKKDWSQYFALQGEIQSYFEGVADEYDLRSQIRFNTTVESADYDATRTRWSVTLRERTGELSTIEADILISAVGLLNVPKLPDIQGIQAFNGVVFHTARWPADLDLSDKRVGIIGTGATAMQIVPAIADSVQSLTIFQRSKQWAAPFEKFKKKVPEDVQFLLREVPYYQPWYRQRLSWIFNDRIHSSLQIDPDWPHQERSINRVNDRHRQYFTEYIEQELGDRQDLLPDVLPEYPPFGKRMLMDNGWFRTVAKPNVHLVTSGIREVDGNAVITKDRKRHELDVLIVSTGFDVVNMLSSLNLVGKDGTSIRDVWGKTGPEAYLGVAIPNFPNFFVLAGPNTALGHGGSAVALLESQAHFVVGLIGKALRQQSGRFEMEVKQERHDEYNRRVQDAHSRMIWSHGGMSNWYKNAQGKVVAPTPFRNDENWMEMRQTGLSAFNVRGVGKNRDLS